MKKTLISKIFQNNHWLTMKVVKENKLDKHRTTSICEKTIRRAVKWKVVRYDTKCEIWLALGQLWLIDCKNVRIMDLFD